MQFPNEPQQDWVARSQHLTNAHKFGECNQSKKFFRADHFRQHLKHSHSGQSGKWTNMLETACMREEPLPTPDGGSAVAERPAPAPPALAPHPAPPNAQAQAQAQAHAQASQQSLQLQQKAQMAAAHAISSHQQQFTQPGMSGQPGGMGAQGGMSGPQAPLSIEQAAALAGASAAGAAGGAPMAMMGGNPRPYVTMAPPNQGGPPPVAPVQETNLFAAQPSAAEEGNVKGEM
jgi:hypothetical protein